MASAPTREWSVPLYTPREASRFLHTPRRTLLGWAKGYPRASSDENRTYAGLLPDEATLTFGGLVEMLYVKAFRDAGVPLAAI